MRESAVLVVLAFLATVLAPVEVGARTIRRSCRDGALRTSGSGQLGASCDADAQCDGVCSFELPGAATTFSVPVGTTRRERIAIEPGAAPTKLVLRCQPAPRSAHCLLIITTTTSRPSTTSTTSPPGSRGTTTTTMGRVGPASTSTTTTTSTQAVATSTTEPPAIPCRGDADCDGLASPCAVPFCDMAHAVCAQTCVCVTPDADVTCVLDLATPCLTPADCPFLDVSACSLCYLNACVTDPAPACFSSFTRNP